MNNDLSSKDPPQKNPGHFVCSKKDLESTSFYPSMEDLLRKKLKCYIKKLDGLDHGNLYEIVLKCMEKPLIQLVLEETNWNQKKASIILGINRNTLRKKIKDLKLTNESKK